MKKLVIVLVVIMAGMIGLNISISAHKAEVKAAKEAVFCSNTRQYVEWFVDERARRHARALSYIYRGEENAPEIAEARAQLANSKAAWAAYKTGEVSYKEAHDVSHRAIWKAGKALAAWADRTGRCPADFGEGIVYCYLSYEEDGMTRREESLRLVRGEEITLHESRVRDLFKF